MSLLQALILGIVQGATEYIPVSSSAHLVLVPWLLGWPDPSFAFEVLIQWGTLVGVFIFFWRDIWAIAKAVVQGLVRRQPLYCFEAKLGWLIVVATIPAVVIGFVFKDLFEAAFAAPVFVGGLLIFTAALLVIAERFGSRKKELERLNWLDALIIGFWQAAAILPGISRSGATISGAVLRGFDRTSAARFSFLMSIPALLGAGAVALSDLLGTGAVADELPAIVVGFVAAGIAGYIVIRWLLNYLQNHSLYIFAVYCVAVSLLTIIVAFVRGS
jgi:undecaprenyl-diphosphatase